MPSLPTNSQRLVRILADMVRSAIAWEEKHGGPSADSVQPKRDCDRQNGLTVYPLRIQCVAHRIPLSGGNEHDDDDDPD